MPTRLAPRSAKSRFLAALVLVALMPACKLTDTGFDNPYVACYDNSCVDTPTLVSGVPALVQLTANRAHVCGLTAAGDAWCWGDNSSGQLGDGTDQPRTGPVMVVGGVKFASLSAGGDFTCGISAGSTTYCWGVNGTAQLGQPSADRCGTSQVMCAKQPLALGGHTFISVGTGTRHACAIDTAGAPWCWGFDFLGETGSSTQGVTVATPTAVTTSARFTRAYAGEAFTCALTFDGQAWCWGADNRGEIGHPVPACGSVAGFVSYCTPTPGPVATSARFTTLSLMAGDACGLVSGTGAVQCWGDNGQGQLGTHDYANPGVPVTAQGGATFTTINANGPATCGTLTSGTSVCWGLNMFGKLGIGPQRIDLSPDPLPIAGGHQFVTFAGGPDFVCGLTAAGAAYCWGGGRYGQLGAGPRLP